jgi:uncharacterized protein YhaN
MRLRRLDLTRYGKFTDHSIDFGEVISGQPDLHIVYGPNEAGKSTALTAFLDLLFGIEKHSRYNFRHPYATMRIGALLETSAGQREIARIKRQQGDLLGPSDQPVPEGSLLGELGGLGRASYQSMFCLDDDSLEAGGKSILDSRGELGQLLFAASSGLADLSQTLVTLRAEADGFYKFHGRSGELARLRTSLADLKAQRDQLDTVASEYHRLVGVRGSELELYRQALENRTRVQSRKEVIQRQVSALPWMGKLRQIRERMEPMADLPDPPDGWAPELPKLQTDEVKLATQAEALDRDIAAKSDELATIVVDDIASRVSLRFDSLGQQQARYVTAELDIPDRRQDALAVGMKIDRILHQLGRTDEPNPERLIIPARPSTALRGLIEARSGITEAVKAAKEEHSASLLRLNKVRTDLEEASGSSKKSAGADARTTRLRTAVTNLRGSDYALRRRNAERTREASKAKLADALSALRPWCGDAEALATITVPDEVVIGRWKTMLERAQREFDKNESQLGQLDGEAGRLQAELDSLAKLVGVVSDQEATTVRELRETAWAKHRRKLNVASADDFEAALRHDDSVMSARLAHQSELARAHEIDRARAIQEADRIHIRALMKKAADQRDLIMGEIAATLAEGAGLGGLPTNILPDQLTSWLRRREMALDEFGIVQQADKDAKTAEEDAAEARKCLLMALADSGISHDPSAETIALLAVADEAVALEAELKGLRKAVRANIDDQTRRALALQDADTRERDWLTEWQQACASCWLGDTEPVPDPAAVSTIFLALGELSTLLSTRSDLVGRIQAMEEDQRNFRSEISDIARQFGIVLGDRTALDLAQEIGERVRSAKNALAARERAREDLAQIQEQQRKLVQVQETNAKRTAQMTSFFAVGSLEDVRLKLQEASERAELRKQESQAEAEISKVLRVGSTEEAEAQLAELSQTALEEEILALNAEFEDMDKRTQELFARSQMAADKVAAIGGDDAAAQIEVMRRTVKLEIEQNAAAYLRLRAGIVAAEMALRSYRERHRSSMMARASEAFRTISQGAYTGLNSRPERDSEVLIALGSDGTSKLVDDLSKGTRFQLYLALRAAGYQEFVAMHQMVPFVSDDIMETFDDHRAEEAFKVFAEMGRLGQVIYLTHHRHLCDIALRAVPGVQVHELVS